MIVLDTNVLSEMVRARPAQAVVAWMDAHPAATLFTTTITQAEMLYGVALLPGGRRRERLRAAVEAMFDVDFAGRVLPFDAASARSYARIAAERRGAGRSLPQLDGQVAAIADARGAAMATRNVDDFEGCGVELVDPWRP